MISDTGESDVFYFRDGIAMKNYEGIATLH